MPETSHGWIRPDTYSFCTAVICARTGGGKPLVCACTFERKRGQFSIRLSADIPGDHRQREDDQIRAIGRACVPTALRFAKDLAGLGVAPEYDVRITGAGNAEWTIIFARAEEVGILGRRVHVSFKLFTPDQDQKPEVSAALIRSAAAELKKVAEDLHGALA